MAALIMDSSKYLAKLDRKRSMEESRKKRIFNEKLRLIGIDADHLKRQIQEKNQIKDAMEADDEKIAKHMVAQDQLWVRMLRKDAEERRIRDQLIDEYRRIHQNPEQARDWDITDPERIIKSQPLRPPGMTDVPVSSLLRLDGELQPGEKEYLSNQDDQYLPVYSWKGFSKHKNMQFRKGQQDQSHEKNVKLKQLREENLEAEMQMIQASLKDLSMEIQQKNQFKKELENIDSLNRKLDLAQKERRRKERAEMFDVNVISEAFFDQFGRSSR